MSTRVIGILLLVGGIALFVGGYKASQYVPGSAGSFLGMRFGKETMWYFIGGIAAFVSGLPVLMGRW